MNNQLENRKNRARKHPKAETAQEKNTEQEKAPAAANFICEVMALWKGP